MCNSALADEYIFKIQKNFDNFKKLDDKAFGILVEIVDVLATETAA